MRDHFQAWWDSWIGSSDYDFATEERHARAAWNAAVKIAAERASGSTGPGRRIHPDIPWERMNESAQTAAHSTAQQIAMDIGSLKSHSSKGGE